MQHREASCDVNTTQTMSQLGVIRTIYGSKLANELLEFSLDKGASSSSSSAMNLHHQVRGFISNANYKYVPGRSWSEWELNRVDHHWRASLSAVTIPV